MVKIGGFNQKRRRQLSILCLALCIRILRKKKRERRFWVRPSLLEKRAADLVFLASLDDRGLEPEDIIQRGYFRSFARMPFNLFSLLHSKIKPLIRKEDTNYRKAVTTIDRLSITLRFLATGDSYDSLEKLFGVSKSLIGRIVPEVCRAIILALNEYLKTPSTVAEWEAVAELFEMRWNFPHCIGAVDGRHCPIIQPRFSGSGAQGSISDGGVFNKCSFKQDLDSGALNIPIAKSLPGGEMEVPYVLVADDAFSLSPNIMKPYPGITDEESPQRAYNYRLSRARRVVENAFGIVSARFRVLRKPIHTKVETASTIILACCYLHNFIRSGNSEDQTDSDIIAGSHGARRDAEQPSGFLPLRNQPRRTSKFPNDIRNEFCRYFSSSLGQVPWPIPYH